MRKLLQESDLAGPLYTHLAELGYRVRSEVKDCDIAAVKGEDLLIIELKKTLNLPLLVQAVRRQRMTDSVYVAIPRPSNKWKWWKESRGAQHLLLVHLLRALRLSLGAYLRLYLVVLVLLRLLRDVALVLLGCVGQVL